MKMKKILTAPNLSLPLRIKMVRCHVGIRSTSTRHEKLNFDQRNLKKNRVIRNVSIQSCFQNFMDKSCYKSRGVTQNKNRTVLATIQRRKPEFFGTSKYEWLQLVMRQDHGMERGRRRISWLRNLRYWFGLSSVELFRKVVSKLK